MVDFMGAVKQFATKWDNGVGWSLHLVLILVIVYQKEETDDLLEPVAEIWTSHLD